MATLSEWLQSVLRISPQTQLQLLESLVVLLLLLGLRMALVRLVRRRTDDLNLRYRWRKTIEYLLLVAGLFVVVRIWIEEIGSLATYLGLLSAGLAIALSDLIANLAGWLFILWRRPFEIGDRIEIDGEAGDVVDLRFFQFTVAEIRNWVGGDQGTGRLLHIPNRLVFTHPVANFYHGIPFIWHEIPVLITLESNWEKAKGILGDVLRAEVGHFAAEAEQHRHRLGDRVVFKLGLLTPIVYTAVEASGIQLTMRFLCPPRNRRGVSMQLWEAVLRQFGAEPDVRLAYATQRVIADLRPYPGSPLPGAAETATSKPAGRESTTGAMTLEQSG